MNYTVLWSRSAQSELAELWISAVDRAALSAAADLMDAALASNPFDCGESREQSEFRIMFAYPLAIELQVNQIKRTVVVAAVWQTR
jgi:hypothetical protein